MDCSFLLYSYSLLFEEVNGRQSNTTQNATRAVVHFVSSFSEFYSELVIFLIYFESIKFLEECKQNPFLSRLPSYLTIFLSISSTILSIHDILQ